MGSLQKTVKKCTAIHKFWMRQWLSMQFFLFSLVNIHNIYPVHTLWYFKMNANKRSSFFVTILSETDKWRRLVSCLLYGLLQTPFTRYAHFLWFSIHISQLTMKAWTGHYRKWGTALFSDICKLALSQQKLVWELNLRTALVLNIS